MLNPADQAQFAAQHRNKSTGALPMAGDTDEVESVPKEGTNRGNAGKGRPKGAVNKTTRAAKEAIAEAAEGLGGAERLIAWAKEDEKNERIFWGTIYPKLIPVVLAGDPENPLEVNATHGLSEATLRLLDTVSQRSGEGGASTPVPD